MYTSRTSKLPEFLMLSASDSPLSHARLGQIMDGADVGTEVGMPVGRDVGAGVGGVDGANDGGAVQPAAPRARNVVSAR